MPTKNRRRPEALGTVERLPSGRYRAYYRHEGERFTAPQTFETKDAARGWLATERADRLRGTWRDPRQGATLFGEYAASWFASRTDLAPRTRKLYSDLMSRYVLPRMGSVELGALRLDQITPTLVRKWFAAVSETARASSVTRSARTGSRRPEGHPARAWARVQGFDVPATGRLSDDVRGAWERAGRPDPRTALQDASAGRTVAAQAYGLLRTMCNAAVRDGHMNATPCTLTGVTTIRRAERGTASPEEVQALAAHMPDRYGVAVLVAAWSGLRQGELFALTRRDVDPQARCIRVSRSREGLTKTASSVRTVYLPRFVMTALVAHMDRFTGPHPTALVFTTTGGLAVDSGTLSYMFGRARAAIGRPELTWHDLRHTGATLAYRAGANVRDVQRRLGHSTTRAAMIYAHAVDDSDRVLADRLDAAFGETANLPQPTQLRAVESGVRSA